MKNTSRKSLRIKRRWHHWEKWECCKAGFYKSMPPDGMTPEEAKEKYAEFLSDLVRFRKAMERVEKEWPTSCEQFLTNDGINRVAWLGQSAMCIETGVPSCFRSGFYLLPIEKQKSANREAELFLVEWIERKLHEGNPPKNQAIRQDVE